MSEQNLKQSYENIYIQIKKISDEWDINYTYLNTLKMVIEDNKIKKVDGSIVKFAREYNKTLDKLYEVSEKHAKQANNKNKLHLFVLRNFVDIIKRNT